MTINFAVGHLESLVARTAKRADDLKADVARLVKERDALRAALEESVRTIKALHGPVAWDIYWDNAPEMKRIRAALSEGHGQ